MSEFCEYFGNQLTVNSVTTHSLISDWPCTMLSKLDGFFNI